MRKLLGLLTIALLGLSLAACSTTEPAKVQPSKAPRPTVSATPSTPPVAKQAQPSRTKPLVALTDPDILAYCPATDAVHFDGKPSDVSKIVICTSVTSANGTSESASLVNYGSEALLSAYSVANAKVTGDPCTRVAKDPLLIWITGAGGAIHPVYAPVDACGYPSAEAIAAYQATGLQVLWEADLDANGNPINP
ncbi:MAG: hypothetical protein ABI400_00250 [Lacisediminihabitans sp.]